MRVEIFILLGVTFFTYFNQTSLETIVIPFTEIMFGWSELENSILFCIGGIVIIASYVVIRVLSKRLTDRWIMLIGLATIATGLIIACACLFTRFFFILPFHMPSEISKYLYLLIWINVQINISNYRPSRDHSIYKKLKYQYDDKRYLI